MRIICNRLAKFIWSSSSESTKKWFLFFSLPKCAFNNSALFSCSFFSFSACSFCATAASLSRSALMRLSSSSLISFSILSVSALRNSFSSLFICVPILDLARISALIIGFNISINNWTLSLSSTNPCLFEVAISPNSLSSNISKLISPSI